MAFATKIFRNCCIQAPRNPSKNRAAARGRSSRKLRLLRDHGLIQKIQKSYRYKVTIKGRSILTALIAASNAPVNTFIPKAA
jgi:hypothetical protein